MGYKGRALIENGDIRFDKARVAQHGAELVLIPTPHDVSTFRTWYISDARTYNYSYGQLQGQTTPKLNMVRFAFAPSIVQ